MDISMRFRAWDIEAKKMRGVITQVDYLISGKPKRCFYPDNELNIQVLENSADCKDGKDEFILMLCTGSIDKNNRPLYRGDIFKYQNNLYIIEYRSGCFMADNVKNSTNDSKGFEIWDTRVWHTLMEDFTTSIEHVGNYCENPELLVITF